MIANVSTDSRQYGVKRQENVAEIFWWKSFKGQSSETQTVVTNGSHNLSLLLLAFQYIFTPFYLHRISQTIFSKL